MPASAEAYPLGRVIHVRPAFEILPLQAGEIDQHLLRSRLAGER